MPKNDPSYVRLTERLSGSVLLDVNSGWSISGLDVQGFPEDKGAANFVRTKVRAGALEEASKAEFDEVESSKKSATSTEEAGGFQEGRLQADAEKARKKLTDARKKSKKEEEGSEG